MVGGICYGLAAKMDRDRFVFPVLFIFTNAKNIYMLDFTFAIPRKSLILLAFLNQYITRC